MPRDEQRLAAIASRQDNVVTYGQLCEAGYTRHDIQGRVKRGQLTRYFRGVYLVGHAPATLSGRARAATLGCGEGAVASHALAAALWGLVPPPAIADVTVAGRNPGAKPGLRLHRVSALPASEVRRRGGVRLTSPGRTIFDLAATAARIEVERTLQEAIVQRLVTEAQLVRVLDTAPRRPGSRLLRLILSQEEGKGFTRSCGERALIRLIAAAGLPRPEKNVCICGYLVDAVWPQQRLVVELDGWGSHAHALAFERDRRRDQVLVAAGWRVVRVTFRQLRDEPLVVAVRLAQALSATADLTRRDR